VLFIVDDNLDKCIGDINDSNVLILKCADHLCEQFCFSQSHGRADILFSDVVLLLVSTDHLPGLDLAILFFLNKDMRFNDMLLLSFVHLMPMHEFIKVTPMELLHFKGDHLLCSLAPFI
jgi:hypothetical protein